jgi:hypothetical protein
VLRRWIRRTCRTRRAVAAAVAAVVVLALAGLRAGDDRRPHTTRPGGPNEALTASSRFPLEDHVAAQRVRRTARESREENAAANRRIPTPAQLRAFRARSDHVYRERISGAFAGTTDEILQWAALKWGLEPDVVRAAAVKEAYWYQSTVSDGGISFGILQIKRTDYGGTYPLSRRSTPFNADFYGAEIRACLSGRYTWLNTVKRGRRYRGGDLWGCLGFYYSGRWHTHSAERYIDEVRATLARRIWERPSF